MSTHDHMLSSGMSRPEMQHLDTPHHFAPRRLNWIEECSSAAARLEWLDDLMFAAIEGDPNALQAAADAWHKTRDELGCEVVEESRLQYLRRAQNVWDALRQQPNHPPHKVFAAIEVISLLAGRVW